MIETILIAMLPVFELRGAIPYAMLVLNETALRAFWYAVLGNLLPVIPLLILFGKVERWYTTKAQSLHESAKGISTTTEDTECTEGSVKKSFFSVFCVFSGKKFLRLCGFLRFCGVRILTRLFEHAKKRTKGMERLEALGLAIFVAVPLPGTGAWTGCIVAALFKLRFWQSFLAISAGVLGAGIIVAWLTMLGKLAVSGLLI